MENQNTYNTLHHQQKAPKLTKDEIVNELLIMKWKKIPRSPYKRYEQEALIEHLQLAIKKARERKLSDCSDGHKNNRG